MIHPPEFIPLAEETGLIIPLGERVLRLACQQIAAWQTASLPPLKVSLNISARQFRQENLPELLQRVLAETGIAAEALEFELTESMVMHDVENAIAMLRELEADRVTLALDDFGTGYSSLAYLKRFPIDVLKIDRSFVRDIDREADDAAIAHAVIAMAHSLGLQVTAEGVENEAQLALLRQYGCNDFQGYLFSRPVPAEEFSLLLQNGRSLPRSLQNEAQPRLAACHPGGSRRPPPAADILTSGGTRRHQRSTAAGTARASIAAVAGRRRRPHHPPPGRAPRPLERRRKTAPGTGAIGRRPAPDDLICPDAGRAL